MNGIPVEAAAIYLRPGEWLFGENLGFIKTILGSCVAVTMYHRFTGPAAICHAVLPACKESESCRSYCKRHSRYAGCIIPRMAQMFFEKGMKARDIEVKLFGGSDILKTNAGPVDLPGVGKRNIEQARKWIENERLTLKISDVGGIKGRSLLFDTRTGDVLVRRLGARQMKRHESPRMRSRCDKR